MSSDDDKPIGLSVPYEVEYDEEGYIVDDDDDRNRLASKSQFQREKILAKRIEAQRQRKDRTQAEKLLRMRKEAQKLSGNLDDDDDDSSDAGQHDFDEQPAFQNDNSNDNLQDHLGEESDSDSPRKPSLDEPQEEGQVSELAPQLALADIRKAQILRSALEKVYTQPYFEDYVVNLYCRLYVGPVEPNRTPQYRLCKIVGVTKARRPYEFVRHHPRTTLMLELEHPTGTAAYEMKVISNSPFNQDEFKRWLSAVQIPPTIEELEDSVSQSRKIRSDFRHTPATLQRLREEQENQINLDVRRINNITQAKMKINRSIENANTQGDMERAAMLRRRLSDLEQEQSRRRQAKIKTARVNVNMINAASRRNNARKDETISKRKLEQMKMADHTNRILLMPSVEHFGKRPAPASKEEKLPEPARAPKKRKLAPPTRPQRVQKISPRLKLTATAKESKGLPPKDQFWKLTAEACKAVKFPAEPQTKSKNPEPWLGNIPAHRTSYGAEYLKKPDESSNVFDLEGYLQAFPLV